MRGYSNGSLAKSTTRKWFTSHRFLALGVTVGIGLAALTVPSVALANGGLYPRGCQQNGVDPWSDYCWVNENNLYYQNTGMYVMAVQYVVTDSGFDAGGEDCIDGPNTTAAIEGYHNDHGLGVDGIVGNETRGSLRTQLSYSGINDAYGEYYNVHLDGLRFYWQTVTSNTWFVLDPRDVNGTSYVALGTSYLPGVFC